MQTEKVSLWKSYSSLILLMTGISVGSIIGVFFPGVVDYLKPIGDIFLNLLFITVIPLVFFAVVTSIANIEQQGKLGRILFVMAITFLSFIVIAALYTIGVFYLFPIESPGFDLAAQLPLHMESSTTWGEKIVEFFTVGEFYQLLSRENMLPMLVFSLLLGLAIRRVPQEKIGVFKQFLNGGNEAMIALLNYIMKIAPIGLGAYIAYQVGSIGPQLFGFYAKPLGVYYFGGLFYFFVFYSLYAFVAGGISGTRRYWKNNVLPTFTAVSTCSTLATMPVNIEAARKMGVPDLIASVVVSISSALHKNGSAISSIVKIYVVFQLMGWDFFTPSALLTAIGITIFVSMVEGGIPSGGYIGEMLMISAYNLPQEAIPAVMIIGTLIDPLGTILNATGSTVAAMVVARFVPDHSQKISSPKEA